MTEPFLSGRITRIGVCFGTAILTPRGGVACERLVPGDVVLTASGEEVRIDAIETWDATDENWPILICAHALAEGVPAADLFLAPDTALLDPQDASLSPTAAIAAHALSGLPTVIASHGGQGASYRALRFGNPGVTYLAEGLALCADSGQRAADATALRTMIDARAPFSAGQVRRESPQPVGHLDEAGREHVRGWARWESDGAAVGIRVACNGMTLAHGEATAFRPDLAACGLGDGHSGFTIALPAGLDPARHHLIQACCDLTGTDLAGSPWFVPRDAQAASLLPARQAADPLPDDPGQGHLDQAERGRIRGWARLRDRDEPAVILIHVDGRPIGRVVANGFRADLMHAGIGSARHGFDIELASPLSPLRAHLVEAVFADTGTALPGSPIRIPKASGFDAALAAILEAALDALDDESARNAALAWLNNAQERLRQEIADVQTDRETRARSRRRRRTRGAVVEPPRPRVLVIDECVPVPGRDAGSQALLSHIRSLQRLGHDVGFVAATETAIESEVLRDLGVTQYREPVYRGVEDVLRRHANGMEVVYSHRMYAASAYLTLARRAMPRARLIFSVADLHHLRLDRQAAVEGRPELRAAARRARLEECTAIWQAHATLTHSSHEAAYLRRTVPGARIEDVPWEVPLGAALPDWNDRTGIAFLGHYAHEPNMDAAEWLVRSIMPQVWRAAPRLRCVLAGSAMNARVRALAGPDVVLMADVPDLADLWRSTRLSVAPLRYGAGVKGKIIESFAAGIPCVMTPEGAEGLDLPAPLRMLVADGADALAERIVALHGDAVACAELAVAAREYVTSRFSADAVDAALARAIRLAPARATTPMDRPA
ncbi:glycosyltransferase [Tanticharoenia sakaeratensis]|uniref:Outer membrane protein n=1 Tax=Tanticharoenia sakaeratensis NBRC 103193 TaxID=1231623 RepID=A0A0D6MHH5_9PROT|nr:glycosyltransferase [Tanticharoenia sakaeratensis]GAN52723.1 outer membrane protein [Tanticharoenia sakaeratensis NBRC 103193]GBQ17837.1 glycosyltransferase [Tanticharoenia sakaeratensis NBRC 103193]